MKRNISSYIELLKTGRAQRRRIVSVLTALSVLVSGEVFWQLRSIGTAMQESSADIHIHSPACYESVYTCGTPPDHVHTDACVQQVLVCGETACAIGDAERETADIWEATLPDPMPELRAERIASIAESQLGYQAELGYSRYGDWYGIPYGSWNTAFACFCLHYAGVEGYEIPYSAGCLAWAAALEKDDLLLTDANGDAELRRGDILFLDTNEDGEADRCGVVTGTKLSEDDLLIRLIEGDTDGCVTEQEYLQSELHVSGWLTVPELEPLTEPEEKTEGNNVETDPAPSEDTEKEAEESEIIQEDQEDKKELPEFHVMTFDAETDSGIQVHAIAEDGAFPEQTVMQVSDVSGEQAMDAAAKVLNAANVASALAVDISFFAPDGSECQPADQKKVSVRLVLPEEDVPGLNFSLLHVPDSGEPETIENAVPTSDGVSFLAESFSMYVLATVNGQNGQEVIELPYSNSPSTPYVMYIGDTIAVASDSGSGFQVYNNNANQLARTATGADSNYTFSDGRTGRKAEYFAQNVGTCSIHCGNEDIYIQVVEPPIMVKTKHEYKERDRIREWLANFSLPNQDGYVPNSMNHPYVLNVGEELELYSYVPSVTEGNLQSWKFWEQCYNATYNEDGFADYYKQIDDNTYEHITPTPIDYRDPAIENYRALQAQGTYDESRGTWDTVETEADGRQKHSVHYLAQKTGLTCIHFQTGDYKHDVTMWVRVLDDMLFTHADMEIADGGSYSMTSTKFVNGHKYTEVKVYNAYVSRVNSARVYNISNEQLIEFSSNDDDYQKNGEPGDMQYEFTSAFRCSSDPSKRPKWYVGSQADHVTFDVELTLIPNVKYMLDENGQIVPGSTSELEDDNVIVPSTTFYLDSDDVLDTKNKCPMSGYEGRSGLDFTVRAQSALLEVKADKTLTGRPAEDQEFMFEIFDPDSGEVIAASKNDGEGHVVFENLRFDDAGDSGSKTYHYQMREVKPAEPDPHIQYTDQVFDVTVTVKRSMINIDGKNMEILYAEIDSDQPEFINHIQYTLPGTGGTGTAIFYTTGGVLLSAAAVLFVTKKRMKDENEK